MKIIILTNSFPPEVDGVGDYSYYLAKALVSKGHELHIICRQQKTVTRKSGLNVHAIATSWSKKDYSTILKRIQKIQPDWILIQYVPYAFHPFGTPIHMVGFLKALKQQNVNIFVFLHEFFVGFHMNSIKLKLVALVQKWITKKMAQYANKIATSTDHYVRVLNKWGIHPHQIFIGSNIPINSFEQEVKEVSNPSFTIITFGIRNVQPLIRFFSMMEKEVKDLKLIVCGKNTTSKNLKDSPNIHFTGFLPAKEIADLLQKSDFFIMPDFVTKSGLGGTCLKSSALAAGFAAGLAVMGMKGSMNDRLLLENKHVYLVDFYDFSSWREAFLKVYNNRDSFNKTEAQSFYWQHLSSDTISEKYLNIINPTEIHESTVQENY